MELDNMLRKTLLILLLIIDLTCNAQEIPYINAYFKIKNMLSDESSLSFREAVFTVENAYTENQLNEFVFDEVIDFYTQICKELAVNGSIEYIERDKEIAMSQCATFIFMSDTIPITVRDKGSIHTPFTYNHEDPLGQKNWSNMFVSTLMETNIGNCHSLPYLYKIIMDELGYKSHLALVPNHIYIKANNKKVGWYNIELTCADFPTDAWYAASGYIHTDAIRNGIYMRALSDKEAVAMTLVDLAQGYQSKFGIEDGSFIIKCCDTALEYFPKYINAMLLKAEILTELYRESNDEELFSQMTELYANIHKLGYRKMPQQMYANWLNSLNAEDRNQGVKAILNPKTKMD